MPKLIVIIPISAYRKITVIDQKQEMWVKLLSICVLQIELGDQICQR
jgi:hypothetical protein